MTSISAHYQGFTQQRPVAPEREIFVQVRACGTSHCASVITSYINDAGIQLLKLNVTQPLSFVAWYPAKAVRACSGVDGHCACAGELDD